MKKVLFLIPFIAGTLACNSQPSTTVATSNTTSTITGTIKAPVNGKVYFELLNDRGIATKIDSAKVEGGKFSFKENIKIPNFYQINIANQQKVVLILDGGENIVLEADGFTDDSNRGNFNVKGSKSMDAFQAINKMSADMQSKVASWQSQYQAASAKKNQADMKRVQDSFEAEQTAMVNKVKALIPELGTSLTALWATNFLNIEKDFEIYDQLATSFEKSGAKYPLALQFMNMVKAKKGTALGGEAPDFTLTDLNGKTTKLSDLKGKIVILDFWATWCRPCIMSFPGMRKAMEKHKADDNVKFFFVDTFERVGPDALQNHLSGFVKGRGDEMSSMNILLDKDGGVAQSFSVNGIPAKFCIGKDGKIMRKSEGFLGSDDLIVEEIDRWVAEGNK
jgi:thiol-disulfide isomerase/thioredoxin